MVIIWSLYGHYMVIIWSLYGHYMVTIWSLYGHYMVIIWSLYGHYMVIVWSLYGHYMVIRWSLYGHYMVIIWSLYSLFLLVFTVSLLCRNLLRSLILKNIPRCGEFEANACSRKSLRTLGYTNTQFLLKLKRACPSILHPYLFFL